TKALTTSVELCAIYWHFQLFVWLLMFAMLIGWADGFGVICQRLLS
ncbi:MAG: cytochrome c oxidase subunit III, partial [Methylocystis sp.]